MPYFETADHTRLFYRDWGTGQPIVFIHGWAVGGDLWEYQMTPLAEQGLRCIAYDQRSCGRSDDPGTGYDYNTRADDLASLLEKLDLHAVTLVGHSMGAGVIARYLTRHGAGRIARTMLIAPTTPCLIRKPDNPDGLAPEIFAGIIDRLRQNRAQYLNEIAPGFFGEGTPGCTLSPEWVQWAVGLAMQSSARASIALVHTNSTSDLRDDMRAFTMPTWIVHGDADQGNPIEISGCKTAALIPGSRLIVYENAPHGLFVTHKDRLNQDLLEFLQA